MGQPDALTEVLECVAEMPDEDLIRELRHLRDIMTRQNSPVSAAVLEKAVTRINELLEGSHTYK